MTRASFAPNHWLPVQEAMRPLSGPEGDFSPLLDRVGDAHVVLLGEASHGTHDFYKARAEITRRLIEEKGFDAVAAEADWPEAWRVAAYVKEGGARDAADALSGFQNRFPVWMWRNADVLEFVEWLRERNAPLPADRRVGFYGLDLYSLHASMAAVIDYLEKIDAEAARRARERYACFDRFGESAQAYGYGAAFGAGPSCEDEVARQLIELRRKAFDYANRDGRAAQDAYFYAEQNARLVRNAEEYYRAMFRGRQNTWNLRDRHMAETLEELRAHLKSQLGREPRVVVWAHNSHLGDARATEMGTHRGEWNIGQLVRERHGDDSFLVGFTTWSGTVTAASDWGAPAERKRVRPGLPGSCEDLFHQIGPPNFLLPLRHERAVAAALPQRLLQRAIGVIYRPDTERHSHYFNVNLPKQFDAIIHFDKTSAVVPLDRNDAWENIEADAEAPETYPFGV